MADFSSPLGTVAPVSALDVANQQQQLGDMSKLRGLQAANDLSDLQAKQRSMQASMLSAALNSPDPQASLAKIVPIANRINPSFQFDPNIDPATARLNVMGAVPVGEQPNYQLAQAKANFYKGLMQGGDDNQIPSTPSINSDQNVQTIGGLTPKQQEGLAIFDPAGSNALNATPAGKAAIAASEAQGKNIADAQKRAVESSEGYKQVEQTIGSLKQLIQNSDLPQAQYGIGAKSQEWLSQNFPQYDNRKAANASNSFNLLNESNTINAIRDLSDSGQIKMTRTLENIINRGYLVNPDASKEEKLKQAQIVQTELKNSAIAAQNVSSQLQGHGSAGSYEPPLITAKEQAQSKMQKPSAGTPIVKTQAAFDALPSGAKYVEIGPDGQPQTYRKP